jgi:NADPH-dependent glutamate synthase beta subunit-like oxidoreductase
MRKGKHKAKKLIRVHGFDVAMKIKEELQACGVRRVWIVGRGTKHNRSPYWIKVKRHEMNSDAMKRYNIIKSLEEDLD